MHLLDHSPRIDSATAVEFAEKEYGIRAAASTLPSERDQNFLLNTEAGEQFVLKVSNSLEDPMLLEAQNAILNYLEPLVDVCQRVVRTLDGQELTRIGSGPHHLVRLVNFIPGTPLAQVKPYNNQLLRDVGRRLAQVDRALLDFDHAAIHRDFHWDLANACGIVHQYAPLISNSRLRDIAYRCAADFEHNAFVTKSRRSVIHGDANDYNIIVADSRVVGLIDFGDVVHSYTVGDLAVSLAYVVLDETEPLKKAREVVAGYHEQLPLTEIEFSVLFDLMRMRLCMSICHAAHQKLEQPGNDYLSISQAGVERTLIQLSSLDRAVAIKIFSGGSL